MSAPNSINFGWQLEKGELSYVWMKQPPAPPNVMKTVTVDVSKLGIRINSAHIKEEIYPALSSQFLNHKLKLLRKLREQDYIVGEPEIGQSIAIYGDSFRSSLRHSSDNLVNNRKSYVLRNGQLLEEVWHNVEVGDIIRMENDQFVAADLFLLSTSEANGICYIETAELDGETNLKCRQALVETAELDEDNDKIWQFSGEICGEPPNNHLNRYEGTLTWNDKKYSLDNDKMLLRGCVLRNTKWCYGLVVFAGRDTKLMQNSGKTIFKRTSIDRLLNVLILGIVFFLMSMCLFCTIACGVWETITGQYFSVYLPWDGMVPKGNRTEGATVISILVFFSYAIVMNTVVPISLYVSVEIIRFAHSLLIDWDEKMYYDKKDCPAKARTTTLNEELGQIEYIFSDKTGTLTQNIMTFNKASIGGKSYGDLLDPITGLSYEINEHTESVDFSHNPMYEERFKFYDETLLKAIQSCDKDAHAFFRLLALCHTVMPEEKDGNLIYQAQSPDEEALVSAARNFGFVFLNRTPNTITIDVMGEIEEYELLCILDFNNVRKRMSVIVKRNDKMLLLCKGADSVIYERLDSSCADLQAETTKHLNKFASEGLRTLCLAWKEIDVNYFEEWKQQYHVASTALTDREEKVNVVYEDIEKNLLLIGASAIEDKLQDGVPAAIANLALAAIKIWVLTGDKQETAINIGYSCELLTDDMVDVFIIDALDFNGVQEQLKRFGESIKNVVSSKSQNSNCNVINFTNEGDDNSIFHEDTHNENFGGFALVVNGHSLVHALEPQLEQLFLAIASECKAVICCRVTPLQKALVVELVKKYKKAVTLAIGDGANDVSMIKTAHIGVGISGQEGMQAVLASDFSVAQFCYLERLLLVHGRYSYLRMCKFLRYFFYKNFAFTLAHFWYAFFCGFSAQTLYDPVFISCYNVFFTSLPVLALGIFDQDVNDKNARKYAKLYSPGHLNLLFNKKEFFKSVGLGILTSFIIFFIPYGAFYDAANPYGTGVADHQLFGTVVSALLVIVVTVQIALDTSYWTLFNHIVIWGSVLLYFAFTFLINTDFIGNSYFGAPRMALSTGQFWFTLFLTVAILFIPVVAIRFYQSDCRPTLSDRVRMKQRLSKQKRSRSSEGTALRTASTVRRSQRSARSGYAFAHQEGFGGLIMSGKMQCRNKSVTSLHSRGRTDSARASFKETNPSNRNSMHDGSSNRSSMHGSPFNNRANSSIPAIGNKNSSHDKATPPKDSSVPFEESSFNHPSHINV
ncbi:Phospholipid-transporting ATPase ID [Nymphon striatum]|nr:Phospholipid-transporting ATPase ID [Nymphon striatum]